MRRGSSPRIVFLATALAAATCAVAIAGVVDLQTALDVRAQTQTDPDQMPPAETGIDGAATRAAITPGTPVAPVAPADATSIAGVADNGGSVTTSLGGSDIAVSSVGGSYEVDGPKRRANRAPKMMPKP